MQTPSRLGLERRFTRQARELGFRRDRYRIVVVVCLEGFGRVLQKICGMLEIDEKIRRVRVLGDWGGRNAW